MTLQSIRQLRIEEFLKEQGWSDRRINAAISMLMVRTVYCSSEFKSRAILMDNSATYELVYEEGKSRLGIERCKMLPLSYMLSRLTWSSTFAE